MIDELNDEAARIGGEWVKLRSTEDPPIEGKVLDFESRPKTYEGAPVLSRKSGAQRTEWVFTLDVGNEEPVKLSLNESGQRAVAAALRDAKAKATRGDVLKLAIAENAPDDRSQHVYRAKWTVSKDTLPVPAASSDELEADPF